MMLLHSLRCSTTWWIIGGLLLGASIAGCSGTSGSKRASTDPPAGDPPDPPAASLSAGAQQGKQLFGSLGCMGCHTINGQGGKVGPNLSNEGNSDHSEQWLTTQIRDPKANDPSTIMPAFDNLTKQQVGNLVDYLKSLKTSSAQSDSDASTPTKARNTQASVVSAASVTSGGETWSQVCGECHNLRPPSEYSDNQWAVAVHHMRVRAPLTGQQQKDILRFLQASN